MPAEIVTQFQNDWPMLIIKHSQARLYETYRRCLRNHLEIRMPDCSAERGFSTVQKFNAISCSCSLIPVYRLEPDKATVSSSNLWCIIYSTASSLAMARYFLCQAVKVCYVFDVTKDCSCHARLKDCYHSHHYRYTILIMVITVKVIFIIIIVTRDLKGLKDLVILWMVELCWQGRFPSLRLPGWSDSKWGDSWSCS